VLLKNLNKIILELKSFQLAQALEQLWQLLSLSKLKYFMENVAELHTFGCPRVGDQNFVQYLKSKISTIKRVVHNRDIVPHVPLLTQNFVHPSNEIFFDENMENYKICNDSGEDPSCSNSFYPNFQYRRPHQLLAKTNNI
jgi:hypothetical protein